MAIVRQALGSKEKYEANDKTLEKTIQESINKNVSELEDETKYYIERYGNYYAWGGAGNSYWERLKEGDTVFFGRGNQILFLGRIVAKTEKSEKRLAELLWGESTWSHIYFLEDIINLKKSPIPVSVFNRVANYAETAFFRGISIVKGNINDNEFILSFIMESAEYLERDVEV